MDVRLYKTELSVPLSLACSRGVSRELIAASCYTPSKLRANRADLERRAAMLPSAPKFAEPIASDSFVTAALSSVLGKRGTTQLARRPDEKMKKYFAHLLAKQRLTLGDLIKLHSIIAPDAPPGIRRGYVNFDGWDATSAVYVAPQPRLLGAYLKDIVEFADDRSARLGVLHPLALAVQMILVHPFSDGNGRTARALFVLSALRVGVAIPTSSALCAFVDRLWGEGCLLIHAVCNEVMNVGWACRDDASTIASVIASLK